MTVRSQSESIDIMRQPSLPGSNQSRKTHPTSPGRLIQPAQEDSSNQSKKTLSKPRPQKDEPAAPHDEGAVGCVCRHEGRHVLHTHTHTHHGVISSRPGTFAGQQCTIEAVIHT